MPCRGPRLAPCPRPMRGPCRGRTERQPIARPVPANSQWRARAMPFANSLRRDKTNGQMRGQCHSHAERLAMPSKRPRQHSAREPMWVCQETGKLPKTARLCRRVWCKFTLICPLGKTLLTGSCGGRRPFGASHCGKRPALPGGEHWEVFLNPYLDSHTIPTT